MQLQILRHNAHMQDQEHPVAGAALNRNFVLISIRHDQSIKHE